MNQTTSAQVQRAEHKWRDLWKKGPRRTRWSALPVQAGDRAPALRLPEQTGRMLDLAELWRERPLLLVFWRHFGCGAGFERARVLRESFAQLDAAGLRVAALGQGEPERTAAYMQRHSLPPALTFLCDPEGQAYEAFGLLEGLPHQVLFRLPEPIQRRDYESGLAVAEQRRAAGDPLVDSPWLMPGEFLVDTGGVVRMAYRYAHVFDIPDAGLIHAAIRGL
jgi:peroxiredoxin